MKGTKVEQPLFKLSSRQTSKVKEQLSHIQGRALAAGREGYGWQASFKAPVRTAEGYSTSFVLMHPKPGLESKATDIIEKVVLPAANVTGWRPVDAAQVQTPDDAGEMKVSEDDQPKLLDQLEIPTDWEQYFEHIYDRDSQIYMVVQSIRAFIRSNNRNRFHVVLYGPPGCGKTEITRAVKAMLGDGNVIEYDATSTTAAGAIQDLASQDDSPKVLAIEEIEKTDENALRWLLAALDQRSEIRKLTFRGKTQKRLKVLCIATVNDKALFEKVMAGALASRFPLKLHCPRPSKAVHEKILSREIEKEDGDSGWIAPAVKFSEASGITDPRTVTAICLCGGDDLTSGVFQQHFLNVQEPK